MIWAAIWKHYRPDVVFMTRDPQSTKGGYSANSYVQMLQEQVPAIYQKGWYWQQDNASIHAARQVWKQLFWPKGGIRSTQYRT